MPTVCRLIQIPLAEQERLETTPASLPAFLQAAKRYTGVYRYWHGIQYLLAQHRPDSVAANWLSLGTTIAAMTPAVPDSRVLSPAAVTELARALEGIEPEALVDHYDAAALDAAAIYPGTWVAWEEDFDPLGQTLEHYSYLQRFAAECAQAHSGLLLHFEVVNDGSDP